MPSQVCRCGVVTHRAEGAPLFVRCPTCKKRYPKPHTIGPRTGALSQK